MDAAALEAVLSDGERTGPSVTSIVLLVDRSGSMKPFTAAVPEAIDRFVRSMREAEGTSEGQLAIVTFAERGEVALGFTPLSANPSLRDYTPGGGTRLVDTVRDVLRALLDCSWAAGDRIIVAVITDGKDTSSMPEGRWELHSLSSRAQSRDWTLLTFGIGTDGQVAARSIGFPDDEASAQTLARCSESLFNSLAYVASRSLPPGTSGVVPRRA